jgi:hypothetical protein
MKSSPVKLNSSSDEADAAVDGCERAMALDRCMGGRV